MEWHGSHGRGETDAVPLHVKRGEGAEPELWSIESSVLLPVPLVLPRFDVCQVHLVMLPGIDGNQITGHSVG